MNKKKERPYIRSIRQISGLGYKPKIRVQVVYDFDGKDKPATMTKSMVSFSDMYWIAETFCKSKVKKSLASSSGSC